MNNLDSNWDTTGGSFCTRVYINDSGIYDYNENLEVEKKTNAHGKCLIHYDNNYYHLLTSPSLPCPPLGTSAFNGHASVCHEGLRLEVDGAPRANDNEQLICVTDFLFHQPFLNMLLVFPNTSHFHNSNLHSSFL